MRFFLICTFLLGIFITKAQSSFQFLKQAQYYYHQGMFVQSAISYERVLFITNSEEEIFPAICGKISCLKQISSFAEATYFIKQNIQIIKTDSLRAIVFKEWITCSYLADQLDETLSLIERAKLIYNNQINNSWLNLIKILALNEQTKWTEAKKIYKDYLTEHQLDSNLAVVYNQLPKLKSEDKAQWLATLIPGAGQFYAGKPTEGVINILLHAAGLYIGISDFISRHYLSAWLLGGGMVGSFHMGGVRRSEELIKQYNKKKTFEFNTYLRSKLVSEGKFY